MYGLYFTDSSALAENEQEPSSPTTHVDYAPQEQGNFSLFLLFSFIH